MVDPAPSTASTCPRCRYDLAGLAPDAPCPECELPAEAIHSPMPIVIAEPPQIRHLARLIDVLGEALVIWMALGISLTLVQLLATPGRVPLVGIAAMWIGGVSSLLVAFLVASIAWTDRSMIRPPSFRRTWWLLVPTAASVFMTLSSAIGPLAGMANFRSVSLVTWIASIVSAPLFVCASLYFARLAKQSACPLLARKFCLVSWLASAGVILAIGSELTLIFVFIPDVPWTVYWIFDFASWAVNILVGAFAIRLARHLNTVALPEATRIRQHP
ncbi:MAG: hypothetical protein KF902_09355 [Phycisphaeraceae bacterium]|nr:hypothetical protein [Phycisphaeraceae bacterium]